MIGWTTSQGRRRAGVFCVQHRERQTKRTLSSFKNEYSWSFCIRNCQPGHQNVIQTISLLGHTIQLSLGEWDA